jgi:plasmid stabilization system protein ParE
MEFRVRTTAEAEEDAHSILDRLMSRYGERFGIQWFQTLQEAIASLSRFPKRCPIARDAEELDFQVRQLLYGRRPHVYRILFTIDGDTIFILHIRHGRLK